MDNKKPFSVYLRRASLINIFSSSLNHFKNIKPPPKTWAMVIRIICSSVIFHFASAKVLSEFLFVKIKY